MAPPAGTIRPWRYLAAFVGVVAVLYSLVFFTGGGDPTPKLGIDLQGGTRVTLEARTVDGSEPARDSLDQARQIIEDRVNGLGVSGAEVVLDGTTLVITVPGAEGDQARSLGQTARLFFRPVLDRQPAAGTVPPPGAAVPPTEVSVPPSGEVVVPPAGSPSEGAAPSEAVAPAEPAPSAPPAGFARPGPLDLAGRAQPTPTPAPAPAEQPAPAPDPAASGEPAPPSPVAPVGEAPEAPADPEAAAEIASARETRQSEDQAVRATALAGLDCAAADPLRGNDDPARPLVACGDDGLVYDLGPAFLTGEDIDDAAARVSTDGVGYEVQLNFSGSGEQTWSAYTAANVGSAAAFLLDTRVVSAPTIQGAIPVGQPTSITGGEGGFSQDEAQDLSTALRYGSLPLSFEASEAQTVSATLGIASLRAGLVAGAIGLAVVFVYCLFYYRVLGLLTILSLVLSGVVVYAVLVLLGRWIGFTLDLAGVAGFIVAIGITADSFVVFYERVKDEVRDGRTVRSAVPRAWVRARRTILSADAVSFLAAAVLYVLAVGQVKGFAFTLGMSTVLDLVVVFLVTHPLVSLAAGRRWASRPALSGLGEAQRAGARTAAARPAAAAAGKGV